MQQSKSWIISVMKIWESSGDWMWQQQIKISFTKRLKRKCLLSFSSETFLLVYGSKKCKYSNTHKILPVLYESELWTHNLEGRLKRIFGLKRKVMRGWRTLLEDLMFFWPCIMNWLYINYQLDALIIIYS